jgi:hypothetical protein
VKQGKTITIEKTSFKGWQKQYGRSIGLRAPGMFVAHLARIVANTGGTLSARFSLPDQTEPILPSMWNLSQEKEITALAHLPLWVGTSTA